jgi:spore germination cell wall hydrolase CwlJ-like protein
MRLVSDESWAVLTLWMECRGEPYEGQMAVAEVIQNRMRRHDSSDGTVAGTVLRPYQFSCWNTDDPQRLRAAGLEDTHPQIVQCRQAWRDVLAGQSVVGQAVLYLNQAVVRARTGRLPVWARPDTQVAVIGAHHFFTD